MRDLGKRNLLGVLVDAVDYEASVERILSAAVRGEAYAVTALAVHGLMVGNHDYEHRYRLNRFHLVTPDGQPLRWLLNIAHGAQLPERVYGPTLMTKLCAAASERGLAVYFYGSSSEVVNGLRLRFSQRFPSLAVAGAEPSCFGHITTDEKRELVDRVRRSGARLVFVGLGCPRQEIFVHEFHLELGMPTIAVGAAFDYNSGLLSEPSPWIQRAGLQWFCRLAQEPGRLWKRYLFLNSQFLVMAALQLSGLWKPDPDHVAQPSSEVLCA